ncbi:hypothetical protein [Bacteroides graminisolvens]|uniref:hypothetical protein n=1 Tax=Bacteroides graminisolvens TaxID=477666 RepID=UPI0029C8D57F|nr:hypothetical protein [Bacteroides graminisolvens]
MTHYELEQGLNALYRDLENANNMDEETACRVYNVDCKAEILEVIKEEIETYEAILQPNETSDDDMDYNALCEVQGISRYA